MNTKTLKKKKKITNSCLVCGYCDDPGISFFTFPKDPHRRKLWLENLKLPDSSELLNSRICSKHFGVDDFFKTGNSGRRMLLKKTSLPRLMNASTSEGGYDENENLKQRFNAKLDRFRRSRRITRLCYLCGMNKCNSVSYFQFPSEPSIQFFWTDACHIDSTIDVNNLFLCEKHFLENDFVEKGRKPRLKKNAIPTQQMELAKSVMNAKKSTHSCIICGTGTTKKLSYFGLPKTMEMKSRWEKACNILLTKSDCQYRICSKHFVPDDFTNNPSVAKRLRLKKTAVPSLHLDARSKPLLKEEPNSNDMVVEVSENQLMDEIPLYAVELHSTSSLLSAEYTNSTELTILSSDECTKFSSQEVIVDHEYSVRDAASPSNDFCVEEFILPSSKPSNDASKLVRLQREIIKKQQKHIEILEQRLRKARQKIRILEGFGIQLQKTTKGTDDTTVYVMVT